MHLISSAEKALCQLLIFFICFVFRVFSCVVVVVLFTRFWQDVGDVSDAQLLRMRSPPENTDQ